MRLSNERKATFNRCALIGIDNAIKDQEALIREGKSKLGELTELRNLVIAGGPGAIKLDPTPKKRTISAAGRRRISIAQKQRWVAVRKAKAN